nr:VP2 [Gammapolyomavirus avis]WPM83241.1 VP2 [Gammapolyomavirus avis]WPM83248.1 VP2 [Gammapolyomavirus avis]WPM83255.1 VP2 [Gammapolyomavirus avis]WPM83262.1 VP2 [Gammapolyomavirus avis]
MGAIISAIAGLFELGALGGLAVDAAVNTAEIEAFIGELVLQDFSVAEIFDAIETSGIPLANTAVPVAELQQTAATSGLIGQALSAPSLIAASVKAFAGDPVAAGNNMALQVWRDQMDILFPGAEWFSNAVHNINPLAWAQSLYEQVGQSIWNYMTGNIGQAVIHQIEERTTALIVYQSRGIYDILARALETARWTLTTAAVDTYQTLKGYYGELPAVSGRGEAFRRYHEVAQGRSFFEDSDIQDVLEGKKAQKRIEGPQEMTGQTIEQQTPPGGAMQRHANDWLLPLILGLYGDLTPEWRYQLKERLNVPKRKRKLPTTSAGTSPPSKRRYRGVRRKVRSR